MSPLLGVDKRHAAPGWGDQNFNDCQEGEAVTKPEVNVSGVLKLELKKQPPSH